jgi:hypothetical protein
MSGVVKQTLSFILVDNRGFASPYGSGNDDIQIVARDLIGALLQKQEQCKRLHVGGVVVGF